MSDVSNYYSSILVSSDSVINKNSKVDKYEHVIPSKAYLSSPRLLLAPIDTL